MRKVETGGYIKSIDPFNPKDSSSRGSRSNNKTCGSCWGSGWEIQFQKACPKCNGTGEIKK